MLKRSITGFFIVAILAGVVALRQVSVLFFDALVLVLMYGALIEMCFALKLFNKKFYLGIVLVYPAILACIYIFSELVVQSILLQLLLGAVVFIVCVFTELISLASKRKNGEIETDERELHRGLFSETISTLGFVVYPITLIGTLWGINHFGLNLGYIGIILVFGISMITDTFAYIFGSLIKGKKLAPEISPNKSIAGFVCGAIGGVLVSVICLYLFYYKGLMPSIIVSLEEWKAILMFVLIGVLGTFMTQFGDLLASVIKRKTGIKDFSNVFPGHGGFMDRIDGAMLNSLLVYVVILLFVV